VRNKIIMTAIALVAVFLLGFVPQYIKANRLETELRQFRQEIAGAQLRDLIGLAYVQANQKNYGLAAETSGRFFRLGPRNGEPDAGRKQPKGSGGSVGVAGQGHGGIGEGRCDRDGRSSGDLRQDTASDAEFERAVERGWSWPEPRSALPEPTEAAPPPFHALQHAAVQPGFQYIVDAQARGRAAVHS
jgi:hypothetical protein